MKKKNDDLDIEKIENLFGENNNENKLKENETSLQINSENLIEKNDNITIENSNNKKKNIGKNNNNSNQIKKNFNKKKKKHKMFFDIDDFDDTNYKKYDLHELKYGESEDKFAYLNNFNYSQYNYYSVIQNQIEERNIQEAIKLSLIEK